MKPSQPDTVDAYLETLPSDMRRALSQLRAMIRAAAPGATEAISYRIPVFKYEGRQLVGMAAFKDHCSFFLMSTAVMTAHEDALKRYDTARGTVHFPPDAPLPAALVKRLVKARIAENARALAGRSRPTAKPSGP